MHYGSVLKKVLDKRGIPIKEFAETLGISRQGLYLKFAEERLDDKFLTLLKENGIDLQSQQDVNINKGIPYLGELDIFAGKTDIANADLSEYITEFISIPGFKDANYFVNVRGSSMYPKYVPGEIIALKLCKDMSEIQYGQAYVVITNENRVLKYVRKAKNGNTNLILASANNDYDPFEIERKNVKAMFLVLGKISKDVL